ncbi:PREDICTED: low-density lipoprotein receptor-related protein 6-like [Branchiostoma belcheri]|uniref:Low-density lipoprotein receptor-related protein 6-like n=1 Tax=Branchiostoma belcheri TaxID=7741 RepID=A0A6P4YY41_BRABE|nr:PREDICTED: low-density lipoprotein receptor-related protein 6-like [Branchiostoma belcheri]
MYQPALRSENAGPRGDPGSSHISEPFLLVADYDGETILQVNITSGSTTTLPLGDVGQPAAPGYDPLTDYVYWADDRNDKIHRARRDGSGREAILDISSNTISVANMNGSSTRTLLTSSAVSSPYDLVLDPRNGLMYWADDGNGRIYRAAMNGSNPTTIITGVTDSRAVTIDYREGRLYYSDGDRMYSSDLLGNDIQQLLYESGKLVYGIAVDENYVYWSSAWRDSSKTWHGKVGKLSKSDLTKTVLVEGLESPYGICLSTAAPPGVTTATPTSPATTTVKTSTAPVTTPSTVERITTPVITSSTAEENTAPVIIPSTAEGITTPVIMPSTVEQSTAPVTTLLQGGK